MRRRPALQGLGVLVLLLVLSGIAQASEKIFYFHNDHLGTPQAMSDAAGRTVWTAEYDPFGKATVNQDPDGDGQVVVNNLRFPGQYYDAETGLHYNYHRDYDPATGRYLQPDPIGIQRGRNNLYAYADGNPVSRSDRLGLFSTSDAFWHYFTGSGDVTAYFNEVDIGLQPRDFRGYSSMVASMYKKDGSLAVSLREVRDIGGWAGNQTYSLKGLIQSNVCEWRFKGFIGAFDDPFDFNKMPWGVRAYWKEVVTRAFGYLPAGNSYNIHILGKREVSDGGRWE